MDVIILMAMASVAACLVTLERMIGWKTILRYSTLVDVIFTIIIATILAGTLGGALTAILAGLFMALGLSAANRLQKNLEKSSPTSKVDTFGLDEEEFNEKGWIYNQSPYT